MKRLSLVFPCCSVCNHSEEFHQQPLAMATRTAKRTTRHDWAFKGLKVEPGFQFSPALRE